jgi:hypothetical protein
MWLMFMAWWANKQHQEDQRQQAELFANAFKALEWLDRFDKKPKRIKKCPYKKEKE